MPRVECSAQSVYPRTLAEQPPITRFSFPALSSQDPALALKENLESKWGHGLLEARSEVSGCVLPSEHLFFMKGLAASFPGQGLQSSLESLPGGLLPSPQEALGWEQLVRVGVGSPPRLPSSVCPYLRV